MLNRVASCFRSSSTAVRPSKKADGTPLEYASSCWLPTTWVEVPLLERRDVSHDATKYTFGLPENASLNLPVCSCILLKGPGDVVRPYTPISDSERVGSFELLVKRYPKGAASQYLYSRKVGDKVEFKHMQGNIKRQYPFDGKQNFTLLAAGTGITPMYQALRKLMNTPGDTRKVTLVCGNKSVADILLLPELEEMVKAHPDRLKVVHVIGNTPDDPPPEKWDHKAEVAGGWIDEAKIKKYCPPPADDALVFVCGLPGMYKALCGPREEAELAEGSVLQRLGYSKDMVAKM